ncbi:TerB N-terminal domain-containing protein [Mesorhizobium sp. CAU 1732]|uniref:tellurite resistance TerB family protein n=1 Tax=Mesorhizobium sp. CAU 1732 TaxID=3140358 RepID=UPI0032618B35
MEWLLIGAALAAWLIYRGRRQRHAEASTRELSELAPERIAFGGSPPARRTSQPWSDPRSHPDPRFTEGSNQWERRPAPEPRFADNRHPHRTPTRWIPPGEGVRVAGFSIDAGMLYLGGSFSGRGGAENCLVDPTCEVAKSGSDPEGRTLPYWPSYQSISPTARRTYLQWLTAGRNDPSIGIGYVFIFFYGLERRLFVDGAKDEAAVLIEEVRRLLALHGENYSFKSYATKFLDAAELVRGPDIYRPALSPDLRNGYEMPLSVRLYLGRKLASKEPFDSRDSLLWVLSLPDTNLRTPATRCFEELVELWHIRFAVRHPEGLKVNAPKTRLKLDYRAASGGFECRLDLSDSAGPLPDITAISAPLDGLRDILNSCTEELASYSRLLGRTPEARGTIDAAFLLPRELLTSPSVMGTAVVKRLEHLFGGRNLAAVRFPQLAAALGLHHDTAGKLSAGLCNQIGAFLDKLDIGFEPDRRYGSRNLDAESRMLLFKAKGGAPVDAAAPAYVAARAMVDVAALAAAADGKVEASEFEAIKADIRAFPGLGGVERGRLMAHASTLLTDVPGQQLAMQRMRRITPGARDRVIRSATSAILADGHAGPDEVKFLERLYKSLGLPVEDVYSVLHRGSVVVDEPVSVVPEQRSSGTPIPPRPSAKSGAGLQIDQARLARIRSETSAVSELLAGIFVEEEPAPVPPAPVHDENAQNGNRRFEGLDAAHAGLLSKLLTAGEMERADFEEAARGFRLLPDGAIETINDWGFERFDEPLIEGDDTISIVEHVKTELQGAEAAE